MDILELKSTRPRRKPSSDGSHSQGDSAKGTHGRAEDRATGSSPTDSRERTGRGCTERRTGLLDCRGPRPQAASPEAATERAEQVLEETEADGELVRDERRPSACRLRSGAQRAWRTHPRKTWGPRKGTLRERRSARQPEGRRAAMAWRTRRRERKRHAHKSLVAAAGGPLSCSPQTQKETETPQR